jgi:cathepsin F
MPTGVCTYAAGLAASTPSVAGPIQDKFNEFAAAFGRIYTSAEERETRFKIFVENLANIVKVQGLDSGATYSHKTPFADWTVEEFSARNTLNLGLLKDSVTQQAEVENTTVPDSFDWRDHGAVNDVKNQGACGSCWAFSTVANIEGVNFVKTKKLLSLSEQQLVECDHNGDEGCQGGLPSNAFKYMISGHVGLESEDKYPYTGTRAGSCKLSKSDELVFISDFKQITDESVMPAALVQYGPLSIGLNAGPMQWYMGGIADPFDLLCNRKAIDHGVAIVGFGSGPSGLFRTTKPYWTIRNSWGASWGEKGYYRIVRGKNKCGLTSMVTTAVIGDATVVV